MARLNRRFQIALSKEDTERLNKVLEKMSGTPQFKLRTFVNFGIEQIEKILIEGFTLHQVHKNNDYATLKFIKIIKGGENG